MQLGGALQGGITIPRRRRLDVLVALLVWAGAVARSGVGAEDANAGAGSAVIHDDSGNVHPY
jgi:hypothetical protein